MDVSSSASPLAELIAASLHEAVTASRERYLAVFELQLEARRRPALGATLARLTSVASAITADEHRTLGLRVPPEVVPTLVTLYGGVLFTLLTGPGRVERDAIRQLAHAIVDGTVGARARRPRGARTRTEQLCPDRPPRTRPLIPWAAVRSPLRTQTRPRTTVIHVEHRPPTAPRHPGRRSVGEWSRD